MEGILLALQGALSQGILWGILALGVYITFRILDIADMSVDGSFVTGGAVCAILVINGFNPFLAVIVAFISGLIAGLMTGILITKFEIPSILAGILTQLSLYSINLRIMGQASVQLLKSETMFNILENNFGISIANATLIIGIITVTVVVLSMYWFFGTEIGSAVRATGNNEKMVTAQGVSIAKTKIIGLMLANGLIALSGALITQSQGYANVTMGVGSIVTGIASIIIGEVIFGKNRSFMTRFISIVCGSIIYRFIIAIILQQGLNADYLKLITALIVILALSIPIVMERNKKKRAYRNVMKDNYIEIK